MELSFDSGVKEYLVHGVNGDVTLRFNPADANFAKDAYRAFDALKKKQDERAAMLERDIPDSELFNMIDEIDREMRVTIDDLFGQGVADAVFGRINAYASANGAPIWQNFMFAVLDQFEEGVKRERALADKKISKYTKKYHK